MPQVIAYASTELALAIVGTGAGADIGAVIGLSSIIEGTIYLGLVVGAALLVPKPPNVAQQTPLKQAIPPRRFGYGRARLSGFYMLYESYRDEAQDVIAICEGPIDGFERWFLNDDEVQIDVAEEGGEYHVLSPDGQKYGPDGNHVYLDFRYGEATETYYDHIFDNLPAEIWTADRRGDGIASMAWRYVQGHPTDQGKFFPNGAPRPSVAVRLLRTYNPRINGVVSQGVHADWSWNENPVCGVIDYLTSTEHGMGLPFEQFILPHIGTFKTAADVCAETVEVADYATTTAQAQTAGNDTLILRAVAGLSAGMSVVVGYGSADIETKIVDSISANTVTFTTNLAHDHPQGDECRWAANGQVTEERYRIGGAWDFSADPAEVLGELLGAMDGWLGQAGDGGLKLYAGKYYEPTVTFGDDTVLDYSVQHFQTDEQAVNQLLPSYTDPNYQFNNADAGEWNDLADQTARGRLRSKPFALPKVPSRGQARRLAKRVMSRHSQELRGTVKTNLDGMNGLGERFIRLQISENQSLVDLVVEIQTGVKIDLAGLTITFPWIAADPAVDAWTIAEETGGTPANVIASTPRIPNTGLGAPTIDVITPIYDQSSSSDTGARLSIEVTSPLERNVGWIVRWSPTTLDAWTEVPITTADDGATVFLTTGFVNAVGVLDVEVAYTTAGGQSDWSAIHTVTVSAPTTIFDAAVDGRMGASVSNTLPTSATVTANQILNIWSSGGVAKVRPADTADDTKTADAVVTSGFASGATATIFLPGQLVGGFSSLTPGDVYFLAASGGITATVPTSGWSQIVGKAHSATVLYFAPEPGEFL